MTSGLREDDCLSLLLLYEKHDKKHESKWWKHIELLPIHYDSIIYYNDDEMELIRGTNLYVIAKVWQKQIHNDYEELSIYGNQTNSFFHNSDWFTLGKSS